MELPPIQYVATLHIQQYVVFHNKEKKHEKKFTHRNTTIVRNIYLQVLQNNVNREIKFLIYPCILKCLEQSYGYYRKEIRRKVHTT